MVTKWPRPAWLAGHGLKTLVLYAGMAAAKHRTSAAQSAALGMVGPAAGMRHLQQLLASAASGVAGGTSSKYWRLLLRSVKQPPAVFQAVLAGPGMDDRVRCLRFQPAGGPHVPALDTALVMQRV